MGWLSSHCEHCGCCLSQHVYGANTGRRGACRSHRDCPGWKEKLLWVKSNAVAPWGKPDPYQLVFDFWLYEVEPPLSLHVRK